MKGSFCLTILAVLLSVKVVYGAESYNESISRCFFVYAPIFEVAKEIKSQELLIYAQKRFAFIAGYIKANQNSPEFKEVFEANLQVNKHKGKALQNRLKKEIQSEDSNAFNQVMNTARNCDKLLGLRSEDIPTP
jgi:hypothetical protein